MKSFTSFLLICALLLTPSQALAQGAEPELRLRLTRDFGYGGFTNDIQGTFSYRIADDAPDNLDFVEFYLDDEVVATVSAAPFEYQFKTDSFAPGEHTLYAIGYTTDGQALESNRHIRVFLTGEEARGATLRLVLPILGILGVVMLLSFVGPMLFNRGKKPVPGQYGLAGGAVCKQCGLPFPRSIWMPNMLLGKLARCPHCGKVAILPRAKPDQLEAAETRYRAQETDQDMAASGESEADRLRRQIDESRYD